ncbi:CRAL-TRIO domain-containing protein [Chytriomyces cf. hyalinus JEL632]|nr:CRAL-TRIO domain-containing protein [Chytriomyces cf. hyalinus JEL632]
MSSTDPSLNDAQLSFFKDALGAHFNPASHSDALLVRFLKARNCNVELAKTMFINWREWYAREGVDDIVANFAFHEHADLRKIYPKSAHKTDKQGRLLLFEQFGKLDATEFFQITTLDRISKLEIREAEKLELYRFAACSKAAGKVVDKVVVVMDVKDYPFMQFYRIQGLISIIANINSNYHPETLGQVLVINAPYLFSAVWSVIVNIIPADTASKCRILGSDYQAALLEIISPENLPAMYGGTCECPGGCNYADVGPWNDGTVEGYPDTFWEGFAQRDMDAQAAVLAAKIAEADVVKPAAAKRGSIASLKERFSRKGSLAGPIPTVEGNNGTSRKSVTESIEEEDVFVDAE